MNLFQAFVLGIIQGLTEFLPVSSSGHLVIAQSFLPGFEQPGVLFDTILHAGTALAVAFYFRDTLLSLDRKYITLIIIGSIPAAIIGLLFQSVIEAFFLSTTVVGIALLVTSVLNFQTDRASARREKIHGIDAFLVGVAQAIAIIPGISRSGSTIFAGTSIGVRREEAAKFSFLLSVPAILGANALQLITHSSVDSISLSVYLTGFLTAFVSGLIAINLVLGLLVSKRFKFFSLYCAIVGILLLIF